MLNRLERTELHICLLQIGVGAVLALWGLGYLLVGAEKSGLSLVFAGALIALPVTPHLLYTVTHPPVTLTTRED